MANDYYDPGPDIERGARMYLEAQGLKDRKHQQEWMDKMYASQLQTEAQKREYAPIVAAHTQAETNKLVQGLQQGSPWKGAGAGAPGTLVRTSPTGQPETYQISGIQKEQLPYKIGHVQEIKDGDKTRYIRYGGRNAQNKDIWEDMPELGGKSGKGLFDTVEEAMKVAQSMYNAIPDKNRAAVLPSTKYVNGKFEPALIPDISQRIPPYTPLQGMPTLAFNRKTGKYVDPQNPQKELSRDEVMKQYGEGAALVADKTALNELTKREQLIQTFTRRIDANVPIVLDAIKDIKNNNPRLLNQALNQGQQYFMGSGKWAALQTAALSLSNEVQRVESNALGIGGQGQEERKIWAKIHDPNMTFKDWEQLAGMVQRLSKTAAGALAQQRKDLVGRITGGEGALGGGEQNKQNIKTKSGKTFIIEQVP